MFSLYYYNNQENLGYNTWRKRDEVVKKIIFLCLIINGLPSFQQDI